MAADGEAFAADCRQRLEHRFIGDVVAEKHRRAAGERRLRHQIAHRVAFVDARTLDLEHRLAEQQFGRLVRKGRAGGRDVVAQRLGLLRRLAIMQRDRITLVLVFEPGAERNRAGQMPAQRFGQVRHARHRCARRQPRLGAVAADGRQLQRREQRVEIADRPPAHQRQRAAGERGEPRQRVLEVVGNDDLERRRADVDQRAVDVEQEGDRGRVEAAEDSGGGVGYRNGHEGITLSRLFGAVARAGQAAITAPSPRCRRRRR